MSAVRSSGSNSQFQIQLAVTLLLLGAAGLCVVGWTATNSSSSPFDLDSSSTTGRSRQRDLHEVHYRLNSPSACSGRQQREPFFLALIHSKAQHFRQRQVIRQTWASQHSLVQAVFLLGSIQQKGQHNSFVDEQSVIEAERSKYGDIVQGADFIDHYRNMTIKNLMGLQWVERFCPGAQFVLKSDDDAFIDVVQLRQFIERTWSGGSPSDDTIICSVHRESPVQRTGKWAVTKAEYSAPTYPPFCSGLAYVMKPVMAHRLLQAASDVLVSRTTPRLWIDDVYVTGLLAEAVRANHFYLNLRYSHQQDELVRWLDSNSTAPIPYIFSELDTSRSDWPDLAQHLWSKAPKYRTLQSDELSYVKQNDIETL